MTTPFQHRTIHESSELLGRREISAVGMAQATLERIAAVEGRVEAFVSITDDLAMQQAAEADRMIAQGRATPLTGVPVVIKRQNVWQFPITPGASWSH